MKGFFSGGLFGACLVTIMWLMLVRLEGPPNGGIDLDDMLSINEFLHQDLRACRDTILTFQRNLDEWRIEVHPDARPRSRP